MLSGSDDDDEQAFLGEDEENEEQEHLIYSKEAAQKVDRGGSRKKRRRSKFIDDVAIEDEDDEEDGDEEYGRPRGSRSKKPKSRPGAQFIDSEVIVDNDEESGEEEPYEEEFIDDNGRDLSDELDSRRGHRKPVLPFRDFEDEQLEDFEKSLQMRYATRHAEYDDEETSEVEQQALLPSVQDPKLWMVKCAIGRERETAACLLHKCISKGSELQIRSAIALDHLTNFIYIEADKEAHVREACKGLRNIYAQKIMLVPIKEMTDVLSAQSKAMDLPRDTWVRITKGTYKGDLAQVVDVDNVLQNVTVRLIPRIDLQDIANKMEGRAAVKKKACVLPPRFMNVNEARELHFPVERRRDHMTGEYFENIGRMMFKDGFLYKTVSMKSITSENIKPTFNELEKFQMPGDNVESIMGNLLTLFSNRQKGHFTAGDAVIIVKGDLKNLKGRVEKVGENVHILPEMKELGRSIAVNEKEICKYFEPGNQVKVISGTQKGAAGMVIKVDQDVIIILSDTTKEHICVFANDAVASLESASGITKLGDYELHDLVLLDNMSCGVIIRLESETFQVLKGVPDRPEVACVRLRDIKCKVDKKFTVQDQNKNTIAVKDVVRVTNGPFQGKQGPVIHIYRTILFIHDHRHLKHAGFICVKSNSCLVVGGKRSNGNTTDNSYSRAGNFKAAPRIFPSQMYQGGESLDYGGRHRGGRGGSYGLVGTTVKIRRGQHKGCRGRVKEIKGQSVRVELESQMSIVTVDRNDISDNIVVSTHRQHESRYSMGSETPIRPCQTPLRPYMTPIRDAGATPVHDGMRTPMRDRAWNPYMLQ